MMQMNAKFLKFTCHDCGRALEGIPKSVLRQNKDGAGVKRVNVCSRCEFGGNMVKKGKRS